MTRSRRLEPPADAIVVLGGGVEPDGSLPSVARARVDRALELLQRGIAPRIIMAGRCSLMGPEPAVTEAVAMAAHAAAMGAPVAALLVEEESRDTIGNAYFTKELFLEPNGWTTVRVVTSDFHLSRAAWVFRKILGSSYDVSFVPADSRLSPHELIGRALEECKLSIFLNEWLEAVEEGDENAIERLVRQEHPGYADAPSLTHEEMRRRLDEIAHISRRAGSEYWLAAEPASPPREPGVERRRRRDRRTAPRRGS